MQQMFRCCAVDGNKHKHTTRGTAVQVSHRINMYDILLLCAMVCERENNKQKMLFGGCRYTRRQQRRGGGEEEEVKGEEHPRPLA